MAKSNWVKFAFYFLKILVKVIRKINRIKRIESATKSNFKILKK